jgi:hypothetical protein
MVGTSRAAGFIPSRDPGFALVKQRFAQFGTRPAGLSDPATTPNAFTNAVPFARLK